MARLSTILLGIAGSLCATLAHAEPTLVSSTPAQGGTVSRTDRIGLVFSEAVLPRTARVQLVMTGMPGMENHGEMKMNAIDVRPAKDGRSIVVTARSPFPAGSYALAWTVESRADTTRGTGRLTFTIR